MLRKMVQGMSVGALALAFAPAANATTFTLGTIPNFYITSGTPFSPSLTANFGGGFSVSTSVDDSLPFSIPLLVGIASASLSTSFSSAANHLVISEFWINGTQYAVPANASGQSVTVGGIPITHGATNTIRVV